MYLILQPSSHVYVSVLIGDELIARCSTDVVAGHIGLSLSLFEPPRNEFVIS